MKLRVHPEMGLPFGSCCRNVSGVAGSVRKLYWERVYPYREEELGVAILPFDFREQVDWQEHECRALADAFVSINFKRQVFPL